MSVNLSKASDDEQTYVGRVLAYVRAIGYVGHVGTDPNTGFLSIAWEVNSAGDYLSLVADNDDGIPTWLNHASLTLAFYVDGGETASVVEVRNATPGDVAALVESYLYSGEWVTPMTRNIAIAVVA